MANFWYKTTGESGSAFTITIDGCLIDLDPITDGDNVWKAVVSNDNQEELDTFETRITAAEGVTIITQTEYDNL